MVDVVLSGLHPQAILKLNSSAKSFRIADQSRLYGYDSDFADAT